MILEPELESIEIDGNLLKIIEIHWKPLKSIENH
jgi:hypothetical protein